MITEYLSRSNYFICSPSLAPLLLTGKCLLPHNMRQQEKMGKLCTYFIHCPLMPSQNLGGQTEKVGGQCKIFFCPPSFQNLPVQVPTSC